MFHLSSFDLPRVIFIILVFTVYAITKHHHIRRAGIRSHLSSDHLMKSARPSEEQPPLAKKARLTRLSNIVPSTPPDGAIDCNFAESTSRATENVGEGPQPPESDGDDDSWGPWTADGLRAGAALDDEGDEIVDAATLKEHERMKEKGGNSTNGGKDDMGHWGDREYSSGWETSWDQEWATHKDEHLWEDAWVDQQRTDNFEFAEYEYSEEGGVGDEWADHKYSKVVVVEHERKGTNHWDNELDQRADDTWSYAWENASGQWAERNYPRHGEGASEQQWHQQSWWDAWEDAEHTQHKCVDFGEWQKGAAWERRFDESAGEVAKDDWEEPAAVKGKPVGEQTPPSEHMVWTDGHTLDVEDQRRLDGMAIALETMFEEEEEEML